MRVPAECRRPGKRTRIASALLTALLLGSQLRPAAGEPASMQIPWKPGVTFTRTSVDDDVRSVLRALLGANGVSVIFRPGVTGKVSLHFANIAPDAAFDQLLQEGGLDASYNPNTGTVTIGPARNDARKFIPLGNVDYPSLRQMLVNFGIGTEGVSYDPTISMVGVSGDAARIAQVTDLLKALEDHYGSSAEQALTDRQRALLAQRSDLQRRAYSDAMNMQVKVIRLRYADVSQTTRSFHGQTINVPGIMDTLRAMLGLKDDAPTPAALPPSGLAPRAAVPFGQPTLAANAAPAGAARGVASPDPDPGFPGTAVSKATIAADARTNSVVVRGSPEAIASVEQVIAKLDQPVRMVQIEVVIATAQVGVAEELGVAFRGAGQSGFGFDTGTTGGSVGAAGTASRFDPVSLLPAALGPQGAAASFVINHGNAFLQTQLAALSQQNKARVLSAPHLVTLDNITARITRAQDIYVPVDTGGLNGQGLSQIQTGLTLEITPSVVPGPDGRGQLVRLSLDATNSAPATSSGSSQISVASQEVQTDVLVPDGGTFVIGGLFDDQNLQSHTGVPVLKDLPVLGALFRDNAKQLSLGETMFFITPHVLEIGDVMTRDVARTADVVTHIAAQRQAVSAVGRELDGVAAPSATRRPMANPMPRMVEEDQ